MKTIITSTGNNTNAPFDKRYGRAAWFCLYDETTGKTVFHKNEYADAQGGAGTKAAEKSVELGAQKIISGDFGPKAKELLEKFKVQMVIISDEDQTIEEIINRLKK